VPNDPTTTISKLEMCTEYLKRKEDDNIKICVRACSLHGPLEPLVQNQDKQEQHS
jgi:hypothetical protein